MPRIPCKKTLLSALAVVTAIRAVSGEDPTHNPSVERASDTDASIEKQVQICHLAPTHCPSGPECGVCFCVCVLCQGRRARAKTTGDANSSEMTPPQHKTTANDCRAAPLHGDRTARCCSLPFPPPSALLPCTCATTPGAPRRSAASRTVLFPEGRREPNTGPDLGSDFPNRGPTPR